MASWLDALLASQNVNAQVDPSVKEKQSEADLDDSGYVRNVLMKGVPGMEDSSPNFTGIDNVAWTKPGIPVTQDDLPPSPTALDLQSLMSPATENRPRIEPAQQKAVDVTKQEGVKQKTSVAAQSKPSIEKEAPPSIAPAPIEKSALQKLLESYGQPQGEDSELKTEQEKRANQQMMLNLIDAASQVGSGLTRATYNPNNLQGFFKQSERGVADLQERRKSEKEKREEKKSDIRFGMEAEKYEFDMDKAKKQMSDEDAKRDPNSEVSKMTKESLANMLDQIDRKDQANKIRSSSLSAKQLDDVYGQMNIQNYISMYEAQQSRMQAAKLSAEAKKASKEEQASAKKDLEAQRLTTHISDKIKQVDEKVGYNKALTDYEMLKDKLSSGKFDSIADVMAVYSLMKALDPGSVVRESEFEALTKRQGGLNVIMNTPERFFKGDLFKPDFRRKLVDQFGTVVGARRKQLQNILKPDLKRAQDLGLNVDHIIAPETTESFKPQAPAGSVSEGAAAELARRRGGK